ncbi:MAG: Fic/DOC family protein [Bacillota bacterium]
MNDPYIYEDVNVLKNTLDLKNQELLEEFEGAVVNLALLNLFEQGYVVKHTRDVFELHRTLFKDVYAWAGSQRTIDIEKQEMVLNGKSVRYASHKTITASIDSLHRKYFHKRWREMDKPTLIENISRYIALLWQIHPFREGNTRTIVTFLYFFLYNNKISMNIEHLSLHAKFFRNALVMASIGEYSEYEPIESILSDTIAVGSNKETNKDKSSLREKRKYDKINKMPINTYEYNYHHVVKKEDDKQ